MMETNEIKQSVRKSFGEALLEAGKNCSQLVVISPEMGLSCRCDIFFSEFPNRYFNFGIAEQNAFTAAAGLASCGKIPLVVSYANFACLRAGEQIRTDISYANQNVKVVALATGLTFGTGGPTHQSYEDITIMRTMPNFSVLVPADCQALKQAIYAAVEHDGPVYIRTGRDLEHKVYDGQNCSFEIGKANVLREGKDISIFACGFMVYEAIQAATILEEYGIDASVIDLYSIKPIDREIIYRMADTSKAIFTVEEHFTSGGMGSAVLECLSCRPHPPVKFIGIEDKYPLSGPTFELREELGLSSKAIVREILKFLGK